MLVPMDVDASRSASDAVRLGAAERAALSEFTSWVRQRFGDRVSELCLFGSRARGEGHEESDLDVLVSVAQLTGSERREIGQQAGDALTHWDVLVSPFALSTQHLAELRARERRIARELDRDAIPL
jgi:predicted nucleotidyltransferase